MGSESGGAVSSAGCQEAAATDWGSGAGSEPHQGRASVLWDRDV